MKKISFYFLILCCGFLVFFVCQPVLAVALDFGLQYGGQSGLGSQDIRVTIAQIIRTCLGILGIVLIVLIIMSGVYYLLSRGDAEKIEKAKKLLISALIGLVIILLGFALVSYIINTLVGPQQPRAEQNVQGNPSPSPEGTPSPSPEGNPSPSPEGDGGGRLPVSYGCTGTTPEHATVCPSPNATNLQQDTPKELVASCSHDPAKCEYICQVDFTIVAGDCVNGDPSLPTDYQAYYPFTADASDSSANHFNGIAYRYKPGAIVNDPSAIVDGYLNLDGSHFVRLNNFPIGSSFTILARVKSASTIWNDWGWIVSSEFSSCKPNSFVIHPNANLSSWRGYVYDKTGCNGLTPPIATYTPPALVNITDWHTYGIEYDSATQLAKMIFDGQVVAHKQVLNRESSNQDIDIGHDSWDANSRFGQGQIDWVYIYDRALDFPL